MGTAREICETTSGGVTIAATTNIATINGRDYDAFAYGRRLGEPSRD